MRGRRSPGRTASRRSAASSGTASSTEDGRLPVVAVILAGGSGTRLWPLARARRPKQFLPLFGETSLFRRTYERIAPLVPPERVVVVAGAAHVGWVRRQTPEIPRDNVILEGIGRNTAASVALAARWARARYGDAVMVVLPADHWIAPGAAFRSTLRRGIGAVQRLGGLLTIGVPALAADSGFGYVRPGGRELLPGVRASREFVEKPPPARARRMVASGRFLWNSGVFVWRATTILKELRRHRPDLARPIEAWARRRRGTWRVPAAALRKVPAVPIDRAVLERSRDVLLLRGRFRWTDLGTWAAFRDLLRKDRRGNAGLGGLMAIGSSGCLGVNQDGLSVFVGLDDVVAVRSGEVVLVCRRGAAQRLRDVVARLRGRYRDLR